MYIYSGLRHTITGVAGGRHARRFAHWHMHDIFPRGLYPTTKPLRFAA